MQNFEGAMQGGPGKFFGKKEEKRTAGQRIRNTFNSASEKVSNFVNGGQQYISNEWQEHAQRARKARSVLVRFLEGAMGEPAMNELLV